MIKRAIQLSSFICAVVVSLLVFFYISNSQHRTIFGTTNQFILNVSKSNVTKDETISELNKIVKRNSAVLVKVVVDPKNYENKKDIIWFGMKEPEPKGIVINNQKISWFNPLFKGEMISSSDMGIRPLYGTYSFKGGKAFQEELEKWTESNGLEILWIPNRPFLKVIISYLLFNGIGNTVLASFLLLLTTLITWFVTRAKSRAIRLLGGVNVAKIHLEDTNTIIGLMLPSFLIGLIASLGYVGFMGGIQQVKLVALQTLLTSFIVFLITSCVVIIFSIIASPKSQHIAFRQMPLKRFNLLSKVNHVIIIVLALIVIPTMITAAIITHKLSKEHALWESMQKYVRLSFNDLDTLETEKMLPEVESFFNDMYNANNLQLSFVVDKAILLTKEDMGDYDHIVVTDRAWVKSLGIGVNEKGTSGKLVSKQFKDLHPPLLNFLNAQLAIWMKSKEMQPKDLKFFEYVGTKFLALPPNVGIGAETVQAKRPLVILVDNPVAMFKLKGFLLNVASSGNVVFPNEKQLRTSLSTSPIKPYVNSIDGIVDIALEMAQKFRNESLYYVMACVLILIAMVFAGILRAQLWAGANQKSIFTLHAFGRSYTAIIKPVLSKELRNTTIMIILGTLAVFIIMHQVPSVLIAVAVSIAFLYGCGSLIAYRLCAIQAFHQASHRH
ncbi:hypothetical protein PV797_01045 [Clostridiaceae bacterium M8S5]|nr:hypothetical protein PV797_01045 [Clostridiaceae bacterium M8S5]